MLGFVDLTVSILDSKLPSSINCQAYRHYAIQLCTVNGKRLRNFSFGHPSNRELTLDVLTHVCLMLPVQSSAERRA
jgi:hypothetical protein